MILVRVLGLVKKKGKKFSEYNNKFLMVQSEIIKIEKKLKSEINASSLAEISFDMPHSLGHGIGLDVHDLPSGIGKKSNWKLKNGMIFAIEPGYYTKEFGIRIENNYLITKKGFVKL